MASLSDAKKLMFKHQGLKQDFDELFRETQALKTRLQEAKEKRSRLIAEVSNSSQINAPQKANELQSLEAASGSGHRKKNYKAEEVAAIRSHPFLDLNQSSEQRVEERGEVQVLWEPLDKKARTGVVDCDSLENDLNLSICRGIGSGIGGGNGATERTGKRKISWQDQVALRV